MQPPSNDLGERILEAVDRREGSRREFDSRSCVNVSTITRRHQLRRQTGAFVAFNRNGTIRTFFKPNDGERYYRRQAERGE